MRSKTTLSIPFARAAASRWRRRPSWRRRIFRHFDDLSSNVSRKRRCVSHRRAANVVHHLRVDVLCASEDGEPRTLGRPIDLSADAQLSALVALRFASPSSSSFRPRPGPRSTADFTAVKRAPTCRQPWPPCQPFHAPFRPGSARPCRRTVPAAESHESSRRSGP